MIYPEHDPRLPVVLVDFDGVLAKNTWPSPVLGEPDLDALDLVEHYACLGCEVHVFTARPESHFPRIWRWLEVAGISRVVYDVSNKKIASSLYFDDRAIRWPIDPYARERIDACQWLGDYAYGGAPWTSFKVMMRAALSKAATTGKLPRD